MSGAAGGFSPDDPQSAGLHREPGGACEVESLHREARARMSCAAVVDAHTMAIYGSTAFMTWKRRHGPPCPG